MNEPVDPREEILMRLRAETTRRQDHSDEPDGRIVAQDIAMLITSTLDPRANPPSEVLRSAAVALAATRQSFLSDHHLSARELDEAMPALRHLSDVAEQLTALGDELAVSEQHTVSSTDRPLEVIEPFEDETGMEDDW